ncbi:MAG: SAP domain-containing protein [Shewanella oncorhynchi]
MIRKLCKECGIDAIGSKSDLLERLSSEMKSRQTYDKVFEKIWGASGKKQLLVFWYVCD